MLLIRFKLFNSVILLNFLLLLASPIHGLDSSRKLDEVPTPGSEKCTPCTPSPPPPPPPEPVLPPPPPPELPPPPPPEPVLPPPPSPKKPPSGYCPPPPPSPSFIIITGPPGSLYPIDNDFGGGGRRAVGLPVLIGCGLLGLLVRFGF